jgi:hypothetical protein
MKMLKNACHFTLGFCDAAMLLAPIYTSSPMGGIMFYTGIVVLLAYFIVFSLVEDVNTLGKM